MLRTIVRVAPAASEFCKVSAKLTFSNAMFQSVVSVLIKALGCKNFRDVE